MLLGTTVSGGYQYRTVKFAQLIQYIPSISLWNPVASIIVASCILPIQSTQTSLREGVGGNNNNFTGSGNNSNLLLAITAFAIAVDGNKQYRPMIVYNPSTEYRVIDMNAATNLNRVAITVYWEDSFGNIHAFELHLGRSANVNLLFRR